jgi:NodT family efflux transporter outer membrane factor (OMF) lipoprotein
MSNFTKLIAISALISSCSYGKQEFEPIIIDENWEFSNEANLTNSTSNEELNDWWKKLGDDNLNRLVELAISDNPDLNIALARIKEARGIRRTSRSFLFPQIGASAAKSRQDVGLSGQPEYYGDASFDASYEIDIWGKNSKNLESADLTLKSLSENYNNAALSLIAEISKTYTEYRNFERQANIAKRNLKLQESTLELIKKRYDSGESPRLDVERSENLVNTTRASIPEFERLKNNKKLELTVLTGNLPKAISIILEDRNEIPRFESLPILLSPANVIANRPDVKAASLNLAANTKMAESITATLFPDLRLSGFFGYSDGGFISSETVWNVALGTAVNLIDFGRIEGRIDASRARESQAFEQYRKAILIAITDVESAINDHTKIKERQISLQNAFNNALKAHEISNKLFKEGEISFIDVLDSERTLNQSDSDLASANTEHTKSVIRLYKVLGVY